MGYPLEQEVGGRASATKMVCPVCNETYGTEVQVCPADGSGVLEVPNAPLLTGTVLDGRYEVAGVIGSGGMGTVYRAWQPSMERDVAIKVLHPQYAHEPRAVKRFFREAQSASRLVHPNIVTVYDFGRSREGQLYMVMELVQGWTLGDLIYYKAPLDPGTVVHIAVQVVDALEEAHKRRTVHRDLKPDNVQLTRVGERVHAKVLDFGIARIVREPDAALETALSTVDIAGTPAYMSPEQILGKDPDPRSDLYSLGILLFEMLTGERPFVDESSVSLCMKQINEPPPRLGDLIDEASVPEALEKLVYQLLAKDAASRPPSAAAVRQRLTSIPGIRAPMNAEHLGLEHDAGALSSVPTRLDASAMAGLQTLSGTAASEAVAEAASPAARLADVLERAKLSLPEPRARVAAAAAASQAPRRACAVCGDDASLDASLACRRCGADAEAQNPAQAAPAPWAGRSTRAGAPEPLPRIARARRAPGALAYLVSHDPQALRAEPMLRWLAAREAAGWGVARHPLGVVVKAPMGDRPGASGQLGAAQQLVDVVGDLLAASASPASGPALMVRAGACVISGEDEAGALDVARRLAAVSPRGAIAVPSTLAAELGLRARALSGITLPSGRLLDCASLGGSQGGGHQPVDGLDGDANLLGRATQLRRLAQLAEEADRDGPVRILVTGPRGSGRTSLTRAFADGSEHLFLRVSPVASAWPGHTAARLVRHALGLADLAPEADVLARLEGLPPRDRDLLGLLVLDKAVDEAASSREVATALVDLLEKRAGARPFLVVLDDAHLMDAASAQLIELTLQCAPTRPWVVIATTTAERPAAGALFEDARVPRVELKALGLRAAASLLESLGVLPHRRNAVLAAGQGNPLALHLLAQTADGTALPPTAGVLTTLLPEALRRLPGKEAEEAWLTAVHGGPEDDRRAVQAARLYLELGLPAELASWLTKRLRNGGGLFARLAAAWAPPTRAHLVWRAERVERLGLWRLADAEYAAAAQLAGAEGTWERLQCARMRARVGDVPQALALFEACLKGDADRSHPAALLRFATVLLEGGENARAEAVLKRTRDAVSYGSRPDLQGELCALLARCAVRRSAPDEAMTLLSRAREVVELLRPVEAKVARALETLVQEVRAEVALATGDADGARTNLRQACDAFRDLGRQADAIRCLVELGRVELDCGDISRAGDTFRAAARLAAAAGLRGVLRRARIGLGEALVVLGEVEEGTRLLRHALREAADDDGDVRGLVEAAIGMARAMSARGLEADALRYAERARTAARGEALKARALLALAEVQLGQAAANAKRLAARMLAEVVDLSHKAGDGLAHERARRLLEAVRLEVRGHTSRDLGFVVNAGR